MKRILLLTGALIVCLFFSCGKSDTPPPTPPVTPPPVVIDNKVTVSGFSPTSAEPGTEVTITGNNFGTDVSLVTVQFGEATAVPVKSLTNTQVVVIVPENAKTGKITIKVNGTTIVSKDNFTVIVPTLSITGFSPKSAKPYEKITITGTGFVDDNTFEMRVGHSPYFDVLSVSSTSIVIQTNLQTPSGKITVSVHGKTLTSAESFTALPQDVRIVDMYGASPSTQIRKGQLGYQMYLQADGLVSDTNKIFISFGGTKPVKANYFNGTSTGTLIPRYAQAGKVTLTVEGRSGTSDKDFVFETSMRDFSPKSFSTGDTIKITGVAFTDKNDMWVSFNPYGNIERPINVTPTEMWVVVPSNAKSGKLQIGVTYGTLTNYSDDNFTFIPRVFFDNSSTPESAKIGDAIRIFGNFSGADLATIGVSFGGSKPVQPYSILGGFIDVKIPVDAKTGKITISRTGYAPFTGPFILTIKP